MNRIDTNRLTSRQIIRAGLVLTLTAIILSIGSISVCGSAKNDFSKIFDNNREKLTDIIDYGSKFTIGYVSTSKDTNIHKQVLAKIKNLSDSICENAETDLEKVQKIEYWVADNLYYNYDAAETSVTPDTISLETVLKTKTATCAGYSNIFSALCGMQGIYCANLRGGTHSSKDAEALLNAPVNHEWNAVLIDDKWIFIDTTWLSNNEYRDATYHYSETMDTKYLDMNFENMSYHRRIVLSDYRNFAELARQLDNED